MKKILIALLVLALLAPAALADGLTSFKAYDISGGFEDAKLVSQDIFAPYDLTMVNVWATWCIYCVEEMPALAELKEVLPENVNMITICDDAYDEPELTMQILELSNATGFTTLAPSEEMYSQILGQVYSYPTTFFMDSQGNAVGYISGVPNVEDPVSGYLDVIDKALELLENTL